MNSETLKIQLDYVAESDKDKVCFASNGFKRIEHCFNNSYSQLVDIHSKHGVHIHYLRLHSGDAPGNKKISIPGSTIKVLKSNEFDILLRASHKNCQYTIWLPSAISQLHFDKSQRFTESDSPTLSYQWEFDSHIQLNLLLPGNAEETAVIPIVILEDTEAKFAEEIITLTDIERRLYRKSDWFSAKRPSDIWGYLINGSIYDPRSENGIDKRFKCQQCAYAWWSYFDFLHKENGKKIYNVIQNEIAYSVLLDMSEKGEWGHGYNSNDIETHARFHLDGIHLLISQYEKTGEKVWLDAAERGISFVSKHLMEELDDGSLWFLHDTIEHRKIHRFKSTLFGKSTGNALIVNTQIQALTVLHRLRILIPNNKIYSDFFKNGQRALRRVLDYQPVNAIYRLLMILIMKYKTRRRAHSIIGKIKNTLEGLIIPKIYWSVRRKYPRFVYPGGFIERDLTRCFFSDRYHIINIKDLLTLYQQEPAPWLRSYIKNGISFVDKFLSKTGLKRALALSPYYIELIDVLYMYDRHIEHVEPARMKNTEEVIYQLTGGYSLDYYASELVHGKEFLKK